MIPVQLDKEVGGEWELSLVQVACECRPLQSLRSHRCLAHGGVFEGFYGPPVVLGLPSLPGVGLRSGSEDSGCGGRVGFFLSFYFSIFDRVCVVHFRSGVFEGLGQISARDGRAAIVDRISDRWLGPPALLPLGGTVGHIARFFAHS